MRKKVATHKIESAIAERQGERIGYNAMVFWDSIFASAIFSHAIS
jgi:hypothetical protein